MRTARSKLSPAEMEKANAVNASRVKLTRLIQNAEQGDVDSQFELAKK
jgi:hypothetical protein